MFKKLFENKEILDFEEALYQSGYEWDNDGKNKYKVYLDGDSRKDFIEQLKRLGNIKLNKEKIAIDRGYELVSDLLKN